MAQMNETLPTIKIDEFEGPLDLLLHLIRISEMDIYDIKISSITTQYLDYLHAQKELQLDIAGEYLVMAATLTEIKGKMLLPNTEVPDDIGDEDDPRNDLMDQLIEYQRYQEASVNLKDLEGQRKQLFTRPQADVPDDINLNLVTPGVQLSDLQKAFEKMIAKKLTNEPIHQTIQEDEVSIGDRMIQVKDQVHHYKQGVLFENLFDDVIDRVNLVTTFMALLELVKDNQVILQQNELFDSILIKEIQEK
ncbi:segregation and condensation protein A [Pediococcus argentinicus]|uniref:Segregation and condensation protein A n=1 Tax=Pediococcus argentinicus TaxID=480391 RepID=A0A0R2NKK1_9LACO|nr:segregation/condensation protein A [Pediococcus argentinicus]KRO26279.1 scpA protein [Pediococcus argentinicus]NKZ21529.1 segregation/condensation protein A [Pediococcus argentinicus]GEP18672.1 segregation and condensation protein A [Pediococcus argentinicus]